MSVSPFYVILVLISIKRYSAERCCFALSDSIFSKNQSLIQDVPLCAAEIVENAIRDNPTLDKKGLLDLIGHGVYDNEGKTFDFMREKNADRRTNILSDPQSRRKADNIQHQRYVDDVTIYGQNTTGMMTDSEKLIKAMNNLIETAMDVANKKESQTGKSSNDSENQQAEPVNFNVSHGKTKNAEETENKNNIDNYAANDGPKNSPTNNIILINNIQYPNKTKTDVIASSTTKSGVNLIKNGNSGSQSSAANSDKNNVNKAAPPSVQEIANVHYEPGNTNNGMLSNANIKPLIGKTDNPKTILKTVASESVSDNENPIQSAATGSTTTANRNESKPTEKATEKEPLKFCLYRKPKAASLNTTNFYFVGSYDECINNCARGMCDIIPPAQIVKLWSGKKQPLDSDMVSICVTKRIYDIGSHCTKIGARNMLMKMLSMEHYLNQPGNAYMIEIISMYGGFFPDNKNLMKGTYLTKHIDSFIEVLNQANHFLTFHNILRCKKLLRTFSETLKATITSLKGSSRREVYTEIYNEVRKTLVRLGLGEEMASKNWLDNLQCQILNQDNF